MGSKTIMIKASDTYVLVIAVSVLPILLDLGVENLWVAFGQGQKKWNPIHDISSSIDLGKSIWLLFCHAFTGCDAVSAFHGKGGKCAWQTWYVWPEGSIVFRKLSQYPPVLGEEKQSILEKFVVTMYDRFSATDNIDLIRLELFFRKQRSYDSTPLHKQLSFNILNIPISLHMGTNNYFMSNGNQEPCVVALEEARWHVANVLDSTSANCSELPTAYEKWLQDWIP